MMTIFDFRWLYSANTTMDRYIVCMDARGEECCVTTQTRIVVSCIATHPVHVNEITVDGTFFQLVLSCPLGTRSEK